MHKYERNLWLITAFFWLIALAAWWQGVTQLQDYPYPYKPPVDKDHGYSAMALYIIVTMVMGYKHQQWVDRLPAARFEKVGDTYTITPTTKHYPFNFAAMVGGFLIMAIPNSYYGNGFATLIAYGFGALLVILLLHPHFKVNRKPGELVLSGTELKVGENTLPLGVIAYTVRNRMSPRKEVLDSPYGHPSLGDGVMQRPLTMGEYALSSAHQVGTDTHAAISNAIANLVNRYFADMRAKSFFVTAQSGGKAVVIAQGMDEASAYRLIDELKNPAAAVKAG